MFYITAINGDTVTEIYAPQKLNNAVCTGTLKEELNAVPTLAMTLYRDNPAFDALAPMSTGVCVRDTRTGEIEFYGRVLTVENGMDSEGVFYRAVTCEGALGYLHDSVYPYAGFSGVTPLGIVTALLGSHYQQCGDGKIFRWSQETITVTADTAAFDNIKGYRSTWEVLQDAVEASGGELKAVYDENNAAGPGWVLYWTDAAPDGAASEDNAICLGTNILSVAKQFDFESVCTRLYAFGMEGDDGLRVNLASVNGDRLYITDSDYETEVGAIVNGYYVNDDITTPEELLAAARVIYAQRRAGETTVSAQVVDLVYQGVAGTEKFAVGRVYYLRCEPLGISQAVRVVGRSVRIEAPYNPTLTLGSPSASLQAIVAAIRGEERKGKTSGGSTKITVDNTLSATSENPVQNKAIYAALTEIPDIDGLTNTDIDNLIDSII